MRARAKFKAILGDPALRPVHPGPGDWALVFQVKFSVAEFADQYLVKSELRKRIFKRLRKEGISIPFPTHTVILENARAGVKQTPAPELSSTPRDAPGRALDLACASGRHARWLVEHGWDVTALDIAAVEIPGAHCIRADLERHEYRIEPDMWDLIVCWLYWQPDLLPEIARGVREGGIVALAGKTTGRFATSLAHIEGVRGVGRDRSGENESRAFFIAMRLEEPID